MGAIRLLLLAVALLGYTSHSAAAIRFAAANTQAAMQTEVDAAAEGDTIIVPPGDNHATGPVRIAKGVKIIGLGGTNSCNIYDDVPSSVVGGDDRALFVITAPLGSFVRISGFHVKQGTRTASFTSGNFFVSGQSKSIRIDNMVHAQDKNTALTIQGGACGVWDNFITAIESHTHAIFVKHPTFDNVGVQGNKAWSVQLSQHTPGGTGNTNKWWIQDGRTAQVPTVPAYNAGSFIDSETGGRWGMSGMAFDGFEENIVAHGDETQNVGTRGTQEIEIVGCTMAGADPNADGCINLRSGAGVICSNNFNTAGLSTTKSFLKLSNYRAFEPYFWGGINGMDTYPNGQATWDQNEAGGPFETGIHNGGNTTYFEDTTKAWTVNQWVGYSAHNLDNPMMANGDPTENTVCSDNQNLYRYAMVNSNTATRLFYTSASYFQLCTTNVIPSLMTWTNGHRLQLWHPTNALGLAGLSKCDLRANGDPPVWLNFENYGVNLWANTWNGVAVNGTNYGLKKDPIYQENFHFFNAVKAGWSFLGRHPLRVDTIDVVPSATNLVTAATQVDFNPSGGGVSSTYEFQILTNVTGGSINASTGLYTVGTTNGTDVVRLYDTFYGNWDDAYITLDQGGTAPLTSPATTRFRRRNI